MIRVDQAINPAVARADSWNPGSADGRRVRREEDDDGPAERRRRHTRTARLAGQQDDRGHDGRPNHRRGGPREDRVGHDRGEGHDRPRAPAGAAAQEPRDERCHDRDVPARDRDDVADAGGGERGRQIAVHAVTQPDQDPLGQAGLRLGQGSRERLAGRPPEAFDGARGGPVVADPFERPRVERGRDADPAQVGPVAPIVRRQRLHRPAGRYPVARRDLGVARQGRGDVQPARFQPEGGDLVAVTRRPDPEHHGGPRSVPGRDRRFARRAPGHGQPGEDQGRAEHQGGGSPASPPGTGLA